MRVSKRKTEREREKERGRERERERGRKKCPNLTFVAIIIFDNREKKLFSS